MIAFIKFPALGIKASSSIGANGIWVLGDVTFIIGLSKFQKPFSATTEETSEAIDEKGTSSCRITKFDVFSIDFKIISSSNGKIVLKSTHESFVRKSS